MITKQIIDIVKNKKEYKKAIKDSEFAKTLITLVPWSKTIEEARYCILNGITDAPRCEYEGCYEIKAFRFYKESHCFYSEGCCATHTHKIKFKIKHGVENPSQLDSVKKKKVQTTMEKFGVENPSQSSDILDKKKATWVAKYGVDHPMKNKDIKNKSYATMKMRYGHENAMKASVLKKKLQETLFNKILERLKPYVTPNFDYTDYVGCEEKYSWKCVCCENTFVASFDNGSVPRCKICYPDDCSYKSISELELFETLQIENKISGDRTILNGKELDIYIPEKRLAIEFNGLYWHSESRGKDKNYHLNKTEQCLEKGIQLIHIFEDEWANKKDLVLSIIHSKLGIFEKRIYARQCTIKEISTKEKNSFLEENHIQGVDKSTVKIGLFYDDVLVSVMTFGHSRFNKNYQYELHRFASQRGYQIIGGASKLFKYFIKKYNPESIISYADRRYSDGTFYEKIGFISDGVSSPNFWVLDKFNNRSSRLKFQKHKLKNILKDYNPEFTAEENMRLNGYSRIWDCGNYKYIWKQNGDY